MNTTATAPVMTVAGVSLPATLPRGEAPALIRSLIGNESTIVALALPGARAEAALAVALGIALQSAVFGDDSAYRRIEARARESGKVTKSGKIAGKLGTMVQAFAQARDFGKAYRDLTSPEFDLQRLLESPLCPALPAPKAPQPKQQQEPQQEPQPEQEQQQQEQQQEPQQEPQPEQQPEMLFDYSTNVRQIIRSEKDQAQRDRAAARIRALRAALKEQQKPKRQKRQAVAA